MLHAHYPTCYLIVGKKHGPPKPPSNSPRYVELEVLPPAASSDAVPDAWHVSDLESLREALPKSFRIYMEGGGAQQGGDQRLVDAMVVATEKQNEKQREKPQHAGETSEATWDRMVPEGRGKWAELKARSSF